MPPQTERKTAAHAAPGRTEDGCTYRRPHWTERQTAAHEESLTRIPQAVTGRTEDDNDDATPGRKEDDNHDAMLGMKKDDNHNATPGIMEDEHDE